MTKFEKVRYEMFLKVNTFGQANPDLFPESSAAADALAAVKKAIARIASLATGKLAARAESRKETTRARADVREQMKAMSRTVRSLALDNDSLASRFRMPKSHSDVSLSTTARWFLLESDIMATDLQRLGLSPTFSADLRAKVDALDKLVDDRRRGRAAAAGAQAAISAAVEEGFRAVRVLDSAVVNVLEHDEARLAAWRSARHLERTRSAHQPAPAGPDAGASNSGGGSTPERGEIKKAS